MAKGKDVRATIILECTNCTRNSANQNPASKKSMSICISRYITQKNRHNMPS
jgi:large subunit ribosomal protein L33